MAPRLAMDADDGVGAEERRPRCGQATRPAPNHLLERRLKPQAMANPVYDRIDVVTLTLAVVLAAGIVFLLAELVPQLADLMMPPPLSGAR